MKFLILRFMVTIVLVIVPLSTLAHDPVPSTHPMVSIVDDHCGMALDDFIKKNQMAGGFTWKVDGRFVPYSFWGAQTKLSEHLFSPKKATKINIAGLDITIVPLGSKAFHRIYKELIYQVDLTCLMYIDEIEVLKIVMKYNRIKN